MLEPCSPVQGFGIRRRGSEVCGCGVVAAVTLILLVYCMVYVKIINIIFFICQNYLVSIVLIFILQDTRR